MATESMLSSWRETPGSRLLGVLAAGLALALALTLTLPPPTATASATSGCSVKNTTTGGTYSRLQRAVRAARPRQTLRVRGTCRGRTVIRKDLTIRGVRTKRWGVPRLVTYNVKTPVVTIARGARVTIRSLAILRGQGVRNRGVARLVDVHVWGWGYSDDDHQRTGIRNTGRLWLLGDSSVARTRGVINRGRLTLGGTAHIRRNTFNHTSGSVSNTGIVIMNDRSNIGHNDICPHYCPPISSLENKGRLVMNHHSSFTGQRSGGGGAIWNVGTLVMNDRASIHHNSSGGAYLTSGGGRGGGVDNAGRLVMRDHSAIADNALLGGDDSVGSDPYAHGGGVYNAGTLVMRGQARISGNGPGTRWTEVQGGGIYNTKGGILVGVNCAPGTLANVYGNTPDDCYFAE